MITTNIYFLESSLYNLVIFFPFFYEVFIYFFVLLDTSTNIFRLKWKNLPHSRRETCELGFMLHQKSGPKENIE